MNKLKWYRSGRNELVWKTSCRLTRHVGSNPTHFANYLIKGQMPFLFLKLFQNYIKNNLKLLMFGLYY